VPEPDPSNWNYPPKREELEAFRLGDGELGVLLVHGFSSTPFEMRGLGEHLASRGFRVHGALLAGHGTTPEDQESTSAEDWIGSAQTQLEELQRETRAVFCAGQSMGGSITLILAARNPEIRAIATLAALLRLARRDELIVRLGAHIRHWHNPNFDDVDLFEPAQARLLRSYRRRSLKAHLQLVEIGRLAERAASHITAPSLVLQGLRDRSVPPSNAGAIARLIGGSATLRYLPRSGHALTVDVDRDEVYADVAAHFLHAAPSTAVASAGVRQL
jgi:carboxylesterase